MTTDEKETIEKDLKTKCTFLDGLIISLFSEEIIDALPEEQQPVLKSYREGLIQIKNHISSEYEAVMMGKL